MAVSFKNKFVRILKKSNGVVVVLPFLFSCGILVIFVDQQRASKGADDVNVVAIVASPVFSKTLDTSLIWGLFQLLVFVDLGFGIAVVVDDFVWANRPKLGFAFALWVLFSRHKLIWARNIVLAVLLTAFLAVLSPVFLVVEFPL